MRLPKWVVRIANEITNLTFWLVSLGLHTPEETRLSLKQSAIGRANGVVFPWGISTMVATSSSSWRMASALTGSETPSRTALALGFTFEVHGTKPAADPRPRSRPLSQPNESRACGFRAGRIDHPSGRGDCARMRCTYRNYIVTAVASRLLCHPFR
jgi:hypothetical protein